MLKMSTDIFSALVKKRYNSELSATQLGARPTSPVKSSQSAKRTVTSRRLGIDRNPDAPPGCRKDTVF
jgi:hypothetical protein